MSYNKRLIGVVIAVLLIAGISSVQTDADKKKQCRATGGIVTVASSDEWYCVDVSSSSIRKRT